MFEDIMGSEFCTLGVGPVDFSAGRRVESWSLLGLNEIGLASRCGPFRLPRFAFVAASVS
jgi:hypothetical protein